MTSKRFAMLCASTLRRVGTGRDHAASVPSRLRANDVTRRVLNELNNHPAIRLYGGAKVVFRDANYQGVAKRGKGAGNGIYCRVAMLRQAQGPQENSQGRAIK